MARVMSSINTTLLCSADKGQEDEAAERRQKDWMSREGLPCFFLDHVCTFALQVVGAGAASGFRLQSRGASRECALLICSKLATRLHPAFAKAIITGPPS